MAWLPFDVVEITPRVAAHFEAPPLPLMASQALLHGINFPLRGINFPVQNHSTLA